jgi:hypothetical protein
VKFASQVFQGKLHFCQNANTSLSFMATSLQTADLKLHKNISPEKEFFRSSSGDFLLKYFIGC